MREICTSGSEEGFAGVTQQIYSPRRPERSEGSPLCGTIVNIMKGINQSILHFVY